MRDWLSQRVVSSPDDTALIRAEDGEAWTYAELDRLVAETAGRLRAHGIGPGDHLGTLMPPYVGTVGLVYAAMRIGATYVPLGERLTPRELSERVDRADLSALVCSESTESDALAATGNVPVLSVDEPTDSTVEALHDVDPEPTEPPEWTFSDRLCLLFTSGTTGTPKPVELTAGNVYASAVSSAFRLGVDPDDRWLVSLSLHHMGGLAPIYRSALYGTTVVLRKGFDPGGTADDIDAYDVTGLSLVPTMLKRTLDSRGTLADSLRVVLLGGAPAPDELIERCRDYSIPAHPTYGMTEAASQIATATPKQARDSLGTVGHPLFGTDVTIVDENDDPVDRGETGEIVVDGPTITPGYYGMDEATDAAFGDHGLHTGDSGRLDEDGRLFVLNRLDDRIISGGENVEPGEVVDVLREYDGVSDAAVVGLDDDVWGERVAALVETEADDGVEVGDPVEPFDSEPSGSTDPDGEAPAESEPEGSPAESEPEDGPAESEPEGSPAESEPEDGPAESEPEDGPADSESESVDSAAEPADFENGTADSAKRSPALGSAIDDAELLSFARDRLAGFKLPRTIGYTHELPRTVSGTVDREAVRETLLERGYEPAEPEGGFDRAGFEPAEPEPVPSHDGAETKATSDDGPETTPADDDPERDPTGDDDQETESADDDPGTGTADAENGTASDEQP